MLVRAAIGLLAYGFLASCMSAPASAGECVSTVEAVKMAQENGLRPVILRGKEMAPLIKIAVASGSTGLEHATFLAVIKTDTGAAVFFGNATQTCGPVMIDGATYNALMRPA